MEDRELLRDIQKGAEEQRVRCGQLQVVSIGGSSLVASICIDTISKRQVHSRLSSGLRRVQSSLVVPVRRRL